jgi:hypothetical protein
VSLAHEVGLYLVSEDTRHKTTASTACRRTPSPKNQVVVLPLAGRRLPWHLPELEAFLGLLFPFETADLRGRDSWVAMLS